MLCRCHYTGKLTSGAVFDSSYERRKPLSFKVRQGSQLQFNCKFADGLSASLSDCMNTIQIGAKQVIAGWDEGILGDGKVIPPMKVRLL